MWLTILLSSVIRCPLNVIDLYTTAPSPTPLVFILYYSNPLLSDLGPSPIDYHNEPVPKYSAACFFPSGNPVGRMGGILTNLLTRRVWSRPDCNDRGNLSGEERLIWSSVILKFSARKASFNEKSIYCRLFRRTIKYSFLIPPDEVRFPAERLARGTRANRHAPRNFIKCFSLLPGRWPKNLNCSTLIIYLEIIGYRVPSPRTVPAPDHSSSDIYLRYKWYSSDFSRVNNSSYAMN